MTVQKSIEFNEDVIKLNVLEDSGNYLIHRDILRQQISQKQGTVSTKTRSEVRGGGKKPWQQKGTGRARAGSSRSPLWRGGGVIFGPKPRMTVLKLNKKERKLAVQTLLYNKRKNILVSAKLEELGKELEFTDNKTKKFYSFCKKELNIDLNKTKLLLVSESSGSASKTFWLATRNLKNVEVISSANLNTLSLLKAERILITPIALNNIKEIYCD
ncbi:50S ribosomal protein L4 (chloroplast) [Thalassiosira oceanica CCMP1005]|uniref:50S ribosomal protein L4 n=1 Tax=Thalassiosira oceanica TaxID=159749 RepID=A0ACA6S195_THAOC|nr:50S ribosomal protein L4 [Thalassiosira oceanica CCMP1005]ADB27575.1 50S ribosomal protein L4 [Thalassiosira oceanica CCMP1005]|eukprot:ADB27575.1 50S ribosomal protein L4 (chloroplast) [Thalassiosira oceanica CCMP1005]